MVLNHFSWRYTYGQKLLPLTSAPSFHRVACVCVQNVSLWWQCSNNYIYCSKNQNPWKKTLKKNKIPWKKTNPWKKTKSKKPKGGEKQKNQKGRKTKMSNIYNFEYDIVSRTHTHVKERKNQTICICDSENFITKKYIHSTCFILFCSIYIIIWFTLPWKT